MLPRSRLNAAKLVGATSADGFPVLHSTRSSAYCYGNVIAYELYIYLRRELVHVAQLPICRSLHSTRTSRLLVSSIKLSTVGGRREFSFLFGTFGQTMTDHCLCQLPFVSG